MFTNSVTVVNYTGREFGKEAETAKFFSFGKFCGYWKGGRCPSLKLVWRSVRVVLCKPLLAAFAVAGRPGWGGALKEDRVAATGPINLGFLTVLHEANGYLGGYLVTNNW